MNNKLRLSDCNSSNNDIIDDRCIKSSDIKLEPKDYDNSSNRQNKDEIYDMEENIDKFDIVDNYDVKNLSTKQRNEEKQEYVGISNMNFKDEYDESDDTMDNIYNTNQYEG